MLTVTPRVAPVTPRIAKSRDEGVMRTQLVYSAPVATASLAQWLRRPPRERKIPGSNPACDGIFSGSSHTSDFKTGTPVATLPGAWRHRVSAGTGRPGVSIL